MVKRVERALLLALILGAPGLRAFDVFELPGLQDRFLAIKRDMVVAVQEKNSAAMEEACRAGRALLPEDPTFAYNLACALALQGRSEAALGALREALELGFTDIEMIRADSDLASIRQHAAFEAVLKQAGKPRRDGAPRRMNDVSATALQAGGKALVSATNTVWDFEASMFRSYFVLKESEVEPSITAEQYKGPAAETLAPWLAAGTAAGNVGDLYDNRDEGHSRLDVSSFPGLSSVIYGAEPRRGSTKPFYGAAMFIYNLPTIGNSSTALTAGPFWRSQARMLVVSPPRVAGLFTQYFANQMYFYPAHKDYGPEHGDVFPFNAPYYVVSVGSSGSDKPFMQAVAATLAAFTPETKRALVGSRLLAPTVQMILRATQRTVTTPEDYYSGVAHPVAFAASNLNVAAMARMAHAMDSNNIPPLVTLRVLREQPLRVGVDFFDNFGAATVYDSPMLVARVFRGTGWRHSLTVAANAVAVAGATNLTWRWALLQGDPQLVRIRPMGEAGQMAELEVAYHEPGFPSGADGRIKTSRVDIGAFASNGTHPSAPAIISFYFLPSERRVYDESHRIVSVEYGGAGSDYVDPLLSYRRQWKDAYKYDQRGHMVGWERTRGTQQDTFTAHGLLVETRDPLGRAKTARAVRYLPRSSGDANALPDLVQVSDNFTFTYIYLGDDDFVGQPVGGRR